MGDEFFIGFGCGPERKLVPRRQARDELFKNSHDENREQGVYKTDQIKMRILGEFGRDGF